MNLPKAISPIEQGIFNLQQGNLETALNWFIQGLRQEPCSIHVSINPVVKADLTYQQITIVISVNEPNLDYTPQSVSYIHDSLTTQVPIGSSGSQNCSRMNGAKRMILEVNNTETQV
jgi:hypothetical protein